MSHKQRLKLKVRAIVKIFTVRCKRVLDYFKWFLIFILLLTSNFQNLLYRRNSKDDMIYMIWIVWDCLMSLSLQSSLIILCTIINNHLKYSKKAQSVMYKSVVITKIVCTHIKWFDTETNCSLYYFLLSQQLRCFNWYLALGHRLTCCLFLSENKI